MARRGGASFDVEAGRRFLASLPEFHPTKPLSQYKPGTIKRKVESFQAQLQAGVPISNRAARGHVVTPEHPNRRRPALPRGTTPATYRGGKLPKSKYLRRTEPLRPPRVHVRPINVPEREHLSDGAVVYTMPDDAGTIQRLYEAGDDRVILSGFDCERGIWRHIGVNVGHSRGMTARAILEQWDDEGGPTVLSLEDWFITMANSTDSDARQQDERLGHVCYWQVYIYPLNPHLNRRNFRAPAFTR